MVPIRWFLRFTSETEYVEIFFTAPATWGSMLPKDLFVGAM